MTARLQAATGRPSARPAAQRARARGHGIGTALDERIAHEADVWAFLFAQLGVEARVAQPFPRPLSARARILASMKSGWGTWRSPATPPHEVLLVRVLLRVGERDQPQQLDEPLLLVGGEFLVDEGSELVERPGAARRLLGQVHELLGLLAREAEDALHGCPHDRALLVLHRGVGADHLEEERRRREAQAVLPRLRRRLGDLRGDALLEEPLERAEHAPPRPYLPPWYLKETLTLAR